jgi:glycosyltransferase involved in cell wall biosynthesis
MRLSIAMPVYNSERFLKEQLASFLGQTRLPDELVVSDDCSIDGSMAIIEAFAVRSPFPVRISVNRRNIGMSKNFERAFELCTGDIILPSDCDDIWLPGKLEKIETAFLAAPEVGLVVSDSELVDESLCPLGRTLVRDSRLRPSFRSLASRVDPLGVLTLLPFAGHAMAFRAETSRWFLPIPDSPAFKRGGWDTWVGCIIASCAGWLFIREPLVLYRHSTAQTSGGAELWSRTWLSRRLGDSSAEYYLQRAEEAGRIYDRLIDNGLEPRSRLARFLDARRRHFVARSRLRQIAFRRIVIILRELLTLRYYRHSFGLLSAVKDLLLPGERKSVPPQAC